METKIQEMDVSQFYQTDAIAYAAYDNCRKLCGIYDGLKISQRKLLYTMRRRYPSEFVKTESFSNICAADTQYLHGAQSLCGVASLMAQGFVGSNNYPLFKGNSGGFGNRLSPEPAAPRYTRMTMSDIAKKLFDPRDDAVLEEQMFENEKIEYKCFMPVLPVILLNGSEGLSTGFAETVFPRNPHDLIAYIKKSLSGTKHPRVELVPWFKNYKGSVRFNKELNCYEALGAIERENSTSYIITELPIGMDYQKYIEFLDKLCDNGDIQDYSDECDTKTDNILFKIKTTREFTHKHDGMDKLLNTFHLIKALNENLCFINEQNSVKEYEDVYSLLDDYIDKRIVYYGKRKEYLLAELQHSLEKLVSKYMFCDGIIKKTIKVADVKKDAIIKQLEKIAKIIKIDGSYSYLLNMPIHSISAETMDELKAQIKEAKSEYDKIKNETANDMWLEDLKG